jgi:transcriptional regulator with PAS, ATPase and Fis domain
MKEKEQDPGLVTQILDLSARSSVVVRKAKLEVVKGPDKGVSKTLGLPRVTVGSSADCELVLSDPAVSRSHFELLPAEDGYALNDLGSTNGVIIRGLRVKQAVLGGGEQIQAGNSMLDFTILGDRQELDLSTSHSFGSLLGRSVAMRQIFAVLEQSAGSDATVLLEGESGTGKDLAALSIHQQSARKDMPFVVVDCGTMTPTLVGSELFGHCKGAFTGAERDRPGAFESAQGGTVFLNEIGEIDPSLQPQLLGVLDKRQTKRLGETSYRPVDVRIIAATNRNLDREIETGRFRKDLFYRLSVVRVKIPPLRNRREDISLIATELVKQLKPDVDPDAVISREVLAMFFNHDWAGNVRELKNVIERVLLFPNYQQPVFLEYEHTPSNMLDMSFREGQKKYRERFEKAYLSAVLDECDGVVAWAAKKAGLPRQTFYRLVTKYKLK